MRIDLLRVALRDEYYYQDTTKETFLDKLEDLFISHKMEGDTELYIYPGKCAGKECENCGKRGYRFVGNHSKNYIDFLFITEGDDIKDIFSCSEFSADNGLAKLEGKDSFYFDFDDQVAFYKSPEYWSKVSAAQAAFSEIISDSPQMLDFEELCYWLDKHASLYNWIGPYRILEPSMKWTPFLKLYAQTDEYRSYISEHEPIIRSANEALKHSENEDQLIEWTLTYESVYDEAPCDLKYSFTQENNYFILQVKYSFLVTGEPFLQMFSFFDSWQQNKKNLLEKYNTFTKEELCEIYKHHGSEEQRANVSSLQFHLDRRKALEEIGVHILFYLVVDDRFF